MNENPQQTEFVLGTCPECKKVVRIPVTAVTSQSSSKVRCPICDARFEIAQILDEVIPSVEVVDEHEERKASSASAAPQPTPQTASSEERINAIDTPELFHGANADYQPKTEKKNGRFVVSDLLSKGSKSSRKKKRSSGRKKSRSRSNDPKVAESLAKLKETASTSVNQHDTTGDSESSTQDDDSQSSSRSGSRSRSRSSASRSERQSSSRESRSSSRRESRSGRSGESFFSRLMAVGSLAELKKVFASLLNRSGMNGEKSKKDSIMVGLGVLIAFPLLNMMLWWFVGVDPLGLARPTSYVTPFVVPLQMRAPADVETDVNITPAESETTEPEPVDFYSGRSSRSKQGEGGKLPTPKIDPSSVHADRP